MLKAVIFDLDGVLVDSTDLQIEAMRIFIASFSKVYSQPQSGREGMRIIDIISDYKDIYDLPGTVNELYKKRQEIYFSLAREKLELMRGAYALLQKIKSLHLKLALATSGDSMYVQLIFHKFPLLSSYFSTVVTGDDVLRGKPYLDIYKKVLESLKIQAHEAVAIEDSVNGITSAKAANLQVICVPNIHYYDADYSQADKIFNSLLEVADTIISPDV